jgi:hypothetical protein
VTTYLFIFFLFFSCYYIFTILAPQFHGLIRFWLPLLLHPIRFILLIVLGLLILTLIFGFDGLLYFNFLLLTDGDGHGLCTDQLTVNSGTAKLTLALALDGLTSFTTFFTALFPAADVAGFAFLSPAVALEGLDFLALSSFFFSSFFGRDLFFDF